VGNPTLVPRMTIVGGETMPIEADVPLNGWSGSPEFYVEFADRFVLDGTAEFEGRPAYRLAITDFSGMNLGAPPGPECLRTSLRRDSLSRPFEPGSPAAGDGDGGRPALRQ
jgi:hypothetical protein